MGITTYVFVFAVLCVKLSLQFSPFIQCSEGPAPLRVRYEGCYEFPCKFKKNGLMTTNNIVTSMDFITVTDSKELSIKMEVKDMGQYMTMMTRPGCPLIENQQCPIKAGENAELTYKFSLPFYTPKKTGFARVSVYNEKEEIQACFEMACVIV